MELQNFVPAKCTFGVAKNVLAAANVHFAAAALLLQLAATTGGSFAAAKSTLQ